MLLNLRHVSKNENKQLYLIIWIDNITKIVFFPFKNHFLAFLSGLKKWLKTNTESEGQPLLDSLAENDKPFISAVGDDDKEQMLSIVNKTLPIYRNLRKYMKDTKARSVVENIINDYESFILESSRNFDIFTMGVKLLKYLPLFS